MRGGATALAAQLLCALCVVVRNAPAQAPLRTRDVGFAVVRYDNGLTLGALSLYETLIAARGRGAVEANGLLSLFTDGRWSAQGAVGGGRASIPIRLSPHYARWFDTMQGEVALVTSGSAQQGLMPTMQGEVATRLRFNGPNRQVVAGAKVARTFAGLEGWRTTVRGEGQAWWQTPPATYTLRFTPMQTQYGDVLADWEGGASFASGRVSMDASLGVRLGEALRGTVGWGTVTTSIPLRNDVWATVSLGAYPVDLLQGLPGGRYASANLRLPRSGFGALRRRPPPPALVRRAPERPELPVTERLALVVGEAWDSTGIREVRVWAPGVTVVELVADFTDWIAVPLVKQAPGEWRGYYRVKPGVHRVNLRLNGSELDVPVNLVRQVDDFSGVVGLIFVR